MPMYWLKNEKIETGWKIFVPKGGSIYGLKLNSRYAPFADSRDATIDLNSGRGDEHQAIYLGLNYYLCGENLKS